MIPTGRRCAGLALVAIVIVVTGCSRGTRSDGDFAPGADRRQTFSRILLVGVSPAYNMRCRFERRLRAALDATGAQPDVSCNHLDPEDPLTRDSIAALVKDKGYDAVLATRLVSRKIVVDEAAKAEREQEPGRAAHGYADDPLFPNFGVPLSMADLERDTTDLVLRRAVVVASDLYETRQGTVVYSLTTETRPRPSPDDVLAEVAQAIPARLRHAGLLP
jgi:hypothetical protein